MDVVNHNKWQGQYCWESASVTSTSRQVQKSLTGPDCPSFPAMSQRNPKPSSHGRSEKLFSVSLKVNYKTQKCHTHLYLLFLKDYHSERGHGLMQRKERTLPRGAKMRQTDRPCWVPPLSTLFCSVAFLHCWLFFIKPNLLCFSLIKLSFAIGVIV